MKEGKGTEFSARPPGYHTVYRVCSTYCCRQQPRELGHYLTFTDEEIKHGITLLLEIKPEPSHFIDYGLSTPGQRKGGWGQRV